MDFANHPGMRFRVGDVVTHPRKHHLIFLRSDANSLTTNWKTCPVWGRTSTAIIIEVKIDMKSIGEIMFKLVTPNGTGWTDWWNVTHS